MAKSTTLALPQTTVTICQTIANATGFSATNPGTAPTNTVLVATAGADDSIVKSLSVASDDTVTKYVQFWISKDGGTTKYLVSTVNVVATSGTDGTVASIDVLGNLLVSGLEIDEAGKTVLRLANGTTLYACVITSAVSTSKTVWITGTQLNY